jgi:hypothetical protein
MNLQKLQTLYRSAPKKRHLLWALPIGILVCAVMLWFDVGLYNYAGLYRATRSEVEFFYISGVKNYIGSALVGSIPILVANWSRTLWPRLAVTAALVAVQFITGSILILAPRAA